jgi:hypothetical protein
MTTRQSKDYHTNPELYTHMDGFSAPLTHPCGCTILWTCENNTESITHMKFFFSSVGKFPCPFCGGQTGKDMGNPAVIRLDVQGKTLLARKTTAQNDIVDGKKNNFFNLPENFLETPFAELRKVFIQYVKILNENGGVQSLATEDARQALWILHAFYKTQKECDNLETLDGLKKWHTPLNYQLEVHDTWTKYIDLYNIVCAHF